MSIKDEKQDRPMSVAESIVGNVVTEIVKQAGRKGWKALTRQEKVVKILDKIGIKPHAPMPVFEHVYAYTLVEFAVEHTVPAPVLDFFRQVDIQAAFRQAFEKNDPALLHREAEWLLQWNKIGDKLRDAKRNPRLEFARFTLLFNDIVERTRTPAEVLHDNRQKEMGKDIKAILATLYQLDLQGVRERNLEKIQGSLVEQVKAWFRTLGYGSEGPEIRIDDVTRWVITIPGRRRPERILVHCLDRQAEQRDIETLGRGTAECRADEGWLIAARRKSQAACEAADKEENLFCYTFDELLDEQADFSRYFKWLEDTVREKGIDRMYIPLAGVKDEFDPDSKEKVGSSRYAADNGWIEGYIDRWLDDPCKEHISILGEFGTGKTWFSLHYAYTLMKKYLKAKERGVERPRLPLVVQLRDYAKAVSSESLFSDFFFRTHEIPLPGYSAFEQLNRLGKLLLIFDGFDEMAARVDRQKMINNFWELARVVVPGAKAILTCRSEHFPEAKEGRALLSAELKASTRKLTAEPPQFEVLELEKFDDDQVRRALSFRTGGATVDFIMGHEQLRDLARRPVMMEYIVEALPDIEAGKPIDLSRIYLYAVGRKLDRDVKAQRTFTSLADKLFFMCELSFEMLTTEQMSLNYRAFPARLRRLFGPAVAEEKSLDHWHYDMMGNTLLIRSEDGDYSLAHRSLAEFFTAVKLTAQLGVLPPDFSHLAGQQSHVNPQLSARAYTWSAFFLREAADNGQMIPIAPLHHFTAEDADGVLTVLAGLCDNVLRFVHEITHTESVWQPFHRRLQEYLEDFKAGRRDPAAQQGILTLLLKFRRLSRSWEEAAGEQEWLRRFWQAHREQEVRAVRSQTPVEKIQLKLPGKTPINIDMVPIPAGSFLMGDDNDPPVHRVHLTRPFLLAPVPVTQALYRAVMDKNPSRFEGDDRPVERVSWLDVIDFCNRLSEKMGLQPVYEIDGDEVNWNRQSNGFRLPTEAEWEYACRAGTTTVFAHGDLESGLDKMAWYSDNTGLGTQPVGLKDPNAWGLHDMHGNVWEWVWDRPGGYPPGPVNDPAGPDRGSDRVRRGGSWYYFARFCRSAIRYFVDPGYRRYLLGVRLSRSLP